MTALPAHQPHSTTSALAAARVIPDAARMRAEVFRAIKRAGKRGLTDQEGCEAIGMSGDTWRPRRVELADAGLIRVVEGRTRPTRTGRQAQVWVAA